MKAGTTLQRGMKTIGRLWEAGQFEEALALVDRLLALSPGHPGLLIYRAQLIQLQDRDDGPTLEDARSDLELAAKLDPESPAALTELGYLSYAVFDDSAAADKHFAKAIARSKAMLREALIGRAKALHELGRDREAFACLAEARDLPASGTLNGVDLLDTFRTLIANDSELDDD